MSFKNKNNKSGFFGTSNEGGSAPPSLTLNSNNGKTTLRQSYILK